MKKMPKYCVLCSLMVLLMISCGEQPYPRSYAYYRIDLPDPAYHVYADKLPYQFELSDYARVMPSQSNQPYWVNIEYPQWNAKIHCSYKSLRLESLSTLIEDSHTLVYKHTIRADAITEQYFENPEHRVYGVLYELSGNAASSVQFFLTDSVHHFVRGSLYFNNLPNADSIAPVNAFITNDIRQLMETLTWK